jgi:hypothetical protein
MDKRSQLLYTLVAQLLARLSCRSFLRKGSGMNRELIEKAHSLDALTNSVFDNPIIFTVFWNLFYLNTITYLHENQTVLE